MQGSAVAALELAAQTNAGLTDRATMLPDGENEDETDESVEFIQTSQNTVAPGFSIKQYQSLLRCDAD